MKRSRSIIVVLFIVLSFVTYSAYSRPCCERWGWTGYGAFIKAGAVMISSIKVAVTKIVLGAKTIQESWSQGFSGMTQGKTAAVSQQQQMEQGALTVKSTRNMEEYVAEQRVQHMPTPMQDTTIANALVVSESSKIAQQNITKLATDWHQSFKGKTAMDTSFHAVIKRHANYCDAAAVAAGCEKLAPAALQNADLDIKTILQPGDGQNPTLSDDERDAGVAWIMNVTNPIAATTPPIGGNMTLDAVLLSDEAALSAAALSLQSILAHRTRRHAFE